MTRNILHLLICLSAALLAASCGGTRHLEEAVAQAETTAGNLPAISHNDSLRFKIYYFEAIKQQSSGNFDAAYDLLRHCLEINPNAAEAYFMLSFYDVVCAG